MTDAQNTVIVIGGGAAGMMAAVTAAEAGARVLLFERNDRMGKKLRITGKGRCNLTNRCDLNTFLQNVPTNPRFLYAALSRFSTEDTMAFFENAGVPLKTERGRRVFPVSDQAAHVVAALERECRRTGVETIHRRVDGILTEDGAACGVNAGGEAYFSKAVILCTGGASYPTTGSDGDGYRFAKETGHSVLPISPSLVPLTCEGDLCQKLQGLSLRNVTLSVNDTKTGKRVYHDFGELMFTHFGLTGPLVLSASAHLSPMEKGRYTAHIDLKPALDDKTLDARLLSDLAKYSNRDLINGLSDLLPQKLIAPFVELTRIDPRKKLHSLTREERECMVRLLKDVAIPISGFRPIREAIITRGGVSTREINPKTMESKITSGLFFAGEVMDVDAYTGGYNLQIAFSTAVLAGEWAAWKE